VPIHRSVPQADGNLPFPDGHFHLVTCLGVLHHIPNVSHVLRELYRCLSPGGHAMVREPIVSMGDWRKPRGHLTPCVRGIPLPLFREMIRAAGFQIVRERQRIFSLISRLQSASGRNLLNSQLWVTIDEGVCRLPIWPSHYHPVSRWQKLRPGSVYYLPRQRA
jgi:SAM-dependent methyltransferase